MAKRIANPNAVPGVVNALTSDSTTDALSAAQGKALNTKIGTLSIRSASFLYSVSANSNTSLNIKTIIDADLPSGYKYVGIAGFSTEDADVFIYSLRYINYSWGLGLRNISNTAKSDKTGIVYYICIKE